VLVQESQDILKLYANSFKSKVTAKSYTFYLKKFSNDLVSLTKLSQKEAEDKIIQFINSKKDNGVGWGPLHLYVAALCKFYIVICDIVKNLSRLQWRTIFSSFPTQII
jgi:transcription initiation factor TFIIIB Brf1 subunit/transcription initiation factor TFIIB